MSGPRLGRASLALAVAGLFLVGCTPRRAGISAVRLRDGAVVVLAKPCTGNHMHSVLVAALNSGEITGTWGAATLTKPYVNEVRVFGPPPGWVEPPRYGCPVVGLR